MYNPIDNLGSVIPRIVKDSTYATHRYWSYYFNAYVFILANGAIEVSLAFCVDIGRIEIHNSDGSWSKTH